MLKRKKELRDVFVMAKEKPMCEIGFVLTRVVITSGHMGKISFVLTEFSEYQVILV